MSLFYTEWCDKHGFDYADPDARIGWKRYSQEEMRRPQPKPTPYLSGQITRTWMDARADELRRRSYQRLYRIIWPTQPLKIVRFSVASQPSQPTL